MKFLLSVVVLGIFWAWLGPVGVIALCAAAVVVWLGSAIHARAAQNRREARIEENLWRARWTRQRDEQIEEYNKRQRLAAWLAAREENAAYKATAMKPGLERLENLR